MSPLCHVCHGVTEQVRGLATTGQLQYFDINPRPGSARSELPGPGPPLARLTPGRSSRLDTRVRPSPGRVTRGRAGERERGRSDESPGPDIKFISRVARTNQRPAFPGAWCQPGHTDQCGGRSRECLINFIGFVSAHSNLGPSIK